MGQVLQVFIEKTRVLVIRRGEYLGLFQGRVEVAVSGGFGLLLLLLLLRERACIIIIIIIISISSIVAAAEGLFGCGCRVSSHLLLVLFEKHDGPTAVVLG